MIDRLGRHLPVIGLTLAAALVVVLSLKVRRLNEDYAKMSDRAIRPYAGMFVPTFQASTLTGQPVTVGKSAAPEGKQVLFFFTTTCPYCKTTLPAWREITAALDTVRSIPVAVYGVSLDSTAVTTQYVQDQRLPFPVLELPERKLSALLRAQSVPLTVVLDAEGRMIHQHLGELTDRVKIDSVLTMVRWKPAPRPAAAPATKS